MEECANCERKRKISTAAGLIVGIAIGAGILYMVNKRG